MIFGYGSMAQVSARAPRGTLFKKDLIFLKMVDYTQFLCYLVHKILYNSITYHLIPLTTLFYIKTGFYINKIMIFLGLSP